MTRPVYLSLGSNLGNRSDNLRRAIDALRDVVTVDAISSLYASAPVGVTDQPEFLNMALVAETNVEPLPLLGHVKQVEEAVGRTTTYRWGPRVVDIDIVLYGGLILETPELTIPHPQMAERAFVLIPLAEIAPNVIDPQSGLTLRRLADRVAGADSVRLLGSFDAEKPRHSETLDPPG